MVVYKRANKPVGDVFAQAYVWAKQWLGRFRRRWPNHLHTYIHDVDKITIECTQFRIVASSLFMPLLAGIFLLVLPLLAQKLDVPDFLKGIPWMLADKK
jgi:hypothetical protein